MATNDLVAALAADLRPVRRIAPVWWRTLMWLLISLPAVGLVAWQAGLRPDLAARFMETRFLLTEIAALLTALSGCYAALCAALPDQPGWKLALPLAPLALWLGTLGVQCWDVFLRLGPAGLALSGDAMCLSAIAEGGLAPALVMVVLLRRGGGFRATHACLCGGLAAAALGAAALRLYYRQDAAIMVIVWQLGSVALLSLVAAIFGRFFLRPAPAPILV
ncbi:MAG: NrsF family protein [Acidibrevibacterium sp.]|uniref:NrsF family protein n=1 Tax=Acidibrevibacterium sp. TaxID=2606776 RepID=UPI003D0800CF